MELRSLFSKVENITNLFINEAIDIRRHIHQNPELSFEESNTSAYIKKTLSKWGIAFKSGYANHGILGIIEGNNPQKHCIALRADMDALPIEETTGLSFCSTNKGVMHACGHDIHTTCLLGAAYALNQLKESFEGTILLIFQPGEEKIPGGAKLMLEDGIFNEYTPECIIGQHVYPDLPAGHIGMKSGSYMASSDEIDITFHSQGGHAALPHTTVDTLLMAAQTLVSLQQITSRMIPANIPAVLTFGNIVCNSVMNIIPTTVKLEGTFRTMNEEWRYKAHQNIRNIAENICNSMGGSCTTEIRVGFPSVYNQPELTQLCRDVAPIIPVVSTVHDLEIRMTAEDFGWFAQKYPSVFYRLGVGYSDGTPCHGLHTPLFNPNEDAIITGINSMTCLALNFLSK